MVDSPSGRVPTKAPRWDLVDTEGYGGGNCVSGAPWMFLGYVGLYQYKKRHIRDILGRTNFFSVIHMTLLTIIVTKPGIIIDVVGSYFYDKKS